MAIAAKPVFSAMGYTDPKTGVLTAGGQQALAQWHQAINSIPISITGESAGGAGKTWTLANTPSGNVSLVGIGANGPVPLTPGNSQPWHFSLNGNQISTQQAFQGVVASYEYAQ